MIDYTDAPEVVQDLVKEVIECVANHERILREYFPVGTFGEMWTDTVNKSTTVYADDGRTQVPRTAATLLLGTSY